jgi:hypothetical protein
VDNCARESGRIQSSPCCLIFGNVYVFACVLMSQTSCDWCTWRCVNQIITKRTILSFYLCSKILVQCPAYSEIELSMVQKSQISWSLWRWAFVFLLPIWGRVCSYVQNLRDKDEMHVMPKGIPASACDQCQIFMVSPWHARDDSCWYVKRCGLLRPCCSVLCFSIVCALYRSACGLGFRV